MTDQQFKEFVSQEFDQEKTELQKEQNVSEQFNEAENAPNPA
jgi:hypothetical protein